MRMEQRFKLINKEKQIKYNNMSEKVEKPDPKAEKINDLMAVVTIMEDYWRFHPANPDKQDVVVEYDQLKAIKDKIEKEIEDIDAKNKS
jgi:hypothetical protein|tara:strand:+ start:1556 stop:1822 length:267 start_codon:yes stop_codon:yes gene_type:complete